MSRTFNAAESTGLVSRSLCRWTNANNRQRNIPGCLELCRRKAQVTPICSGKSACNMVFLGDGRVPDVSQATRALGQEALYDEAGCFKTDPTYVVTARLAPGPGSNGGELREGCLKNRFEMGQIMAFWFWRRPCRARSVLWLWNECRKTSQQRQLAVYCRRRRSKMEIPDKPGAFPHRSGLAARGGMPNA